MPANRRKRAQDDVLRFTRAQLRALTPHERHAYRRELMGAMIEHAREKKEDKMDIPYLPFYRLVKETSTTFKYHMLFATDAVKALHVASEAYMTELFEHAELAAKHANRKTVMEEDLQFVRAINPGRFNYTSQTEQRTSRLDRMHRVLRGLT